MKYSQLLIVIVCAFFLLPSCLISRGPQRDIDQMDQREVYDVRTVRVPMFIAKPVLRAHLKDEHVSKELRSYVSRIKAVKVTTALTRPGFNMAAFREMVTRAPYQNWISVNAYGNIVHISAVEKNNSIRKINIVVAAKDNALVYAMIKCKLSPDELSDFINVLMSDEASVKELMEEINKL